MKSALWVGVLVAAVLISVPVVRSQESLRALQPEDFPRPQRPAVAFAHDAHNEKAGIESCNECHHVYATTANGCRTNPRRTSAVRTATGSRMRGVNPG